MAISWDFEVKDDLLLVVSKGFDESLEEVTKYGEAIVGMALENNSKKIIADERELEYRLSTIDTFYLGQKASQYAKHLTQIAIVCNTASFKAGKFYEDVAVNRGLSIIVTTDMKAAEKWIKNAD